MTHYVGWFFDTYLECYAENEEEARAEMKRLLLEMITQDDDPVFFWEDDSKEKER